MLEAGSRVLQQSTSGMVLGVAYLMLSNECQPIGNGVEETRSQEVELRCPSPMHFQGQYRGPVSSPSILRLSLKLKTLQ